MRGHSSRKDCDFKKLSLKFRAKDVENSPLKDRRKLSLNTHCSDQEGMSPKGRIRGSIGPVRESVVYKWQEALGIETVKTNSLYIEYITSSETKIRQVLVLETKSDFAKRVGGELVKEKSANQSTDILDEVSRTSMTEATLSALLFNA